MPLSFCLVNWLSLLCLSFLPTLPPLWQKVTCCSCWEHLPDDCENKLGLVDCWRKWQMPLPKWLVHKCQEIEGWKSNHFQAEMYHLTRCWMANRSLYAVELRGICSGFSSGLADQQQPSCVHFPLTDQRSCFKISKFDLHKVAQGKRWISSYQYLAVFIITFLKCLTKISSFLCSLSHTSVQWPGLCHTTKQQQSPHLVHP